MILNAPKYIANLTRGAVLFAIVFAAASVTAAITIETYKAKVEAARTFALRVENSLRNDGVVDSAKKELAAQLRRDFPASERIEWKGGSVETSNTWLLERVAALDGGSDSKKQLQAVVEIREHLSAIAFKLAELEQTQASVDRTKDQDKQKLAEILRREEYQKPQQKNESVFQRWLREFLEWLENLFPKPSGTSTTGSAMAAIALFLQIALFATLFGLLVYLVYKLAPLLFPHLRRRARRKKPKPRTILGEQVAEDVTAVDLFEDAERLAREGNLRGAIRKGYIALLCDLSDRKVIGLARNKTNRDYLRDVRSRRDLHPRMKTVTDMFERHWYGFQESGDKDWAQFREEYREAIRSV